jgi:hypothetical protein
MTCNQCGKDLIDETSVNIPFHDGAGTYVYHICYCTDCLNAIAFNKRVSKGVTCEITRPGGVESFEEGLYGVKEITWDNHKVEISKVNGERRVYNGFPFVIVQ